MGVARGLEIRAIPNISIRPGKYPIEPLEASIYARHSKPESTSIKIVALTRKTIETH